MVRSVDNRPASRSDQGAMHDLLASLLSHSVWNLSETDKSNAIRYVSERITIIRTCYYESVCSNSMVYLYIPTRTPRICKMWSQSWACICLLFAWLTIGPSNWRQYIPPKFWWASTWLHDVRRPISEDSPMEVEFWHQLLYFFMWILSTFRGMRWHSWLRHYATSRKVAGSNPDEVDFFNLPNPSSRTMALRSTQTLTEMSTRNLPGGKVRSAHKADNLTAICEPIV
jgi:hypothetical protein